MLKKTIGMGGAAHADTFGKARKNAFTLAEVLITLGIIGVVAAMTMPTLINSTQGAQYKTAYKKALSVMSQAVVMNIALDDYDLSQTVAGTVNGSGADGPQSLFRLFKNRMNVVKVAGEDDFSVENGAADNYMVASGGLAADVPNANHFDTYTYAGLATGANFAAGKTVLFFNDGIAFAFDNTQQACAASTATTNDDYCFGFIDVNGQKGPNRVVQCDNDTLTVDGANADNNTCVVSNPTDIYPIMFFDQSIVPATAAGRAVLYAK